ncbi:SDR family oxidoreductase [Roseomonas sp. SSH11]|uniref:SDR family oxidoreductase n=1 Tax=Pararoseomonas baculiformis TaxID=2820812 RepID=A0ABS4A952_9PROT|nr:SDR family oxidoreductase [Pararoseomonas baculiformis]MBP0443527.1 SDR family oxidoreductase [Pararoseomonas baculiformis]
MVLQGKRAFITGADSGIGQAIAVAFARAGADLAITFHTDEAGAGETARRIESAGRRAFTTRLDVMDSRAVDAAFDAARSALGGLDILVNNAGKGMGGKKPVAELADEDAEVVIRTNLFGPLWCCRAFLRGNPPEGSKIINITSVAQHLPTDESAPYGMSKAGLGSLVRSLSVELAPRKINVVGIAPGLIQTPMTQERLDDPAKREASFKEIPWHRAGQPEEIAKLALFLASPDAEYITGQTVVMDGGLTMNWGGA